MTSKMDERPEWRKGASLVWHRYLRVGGQATVSICGRQPAFRSDERTSHQPPWHETCKNCAHLMHMKGAE